MNFATSRLRDIPATHTGLTAEQTSKCAGSGTKKRSKTANDSGLLCCRVCKQGNREEIDGC